MPAFTLTLPETPIAQGRETGSTGGKIRKYNDIPARKKSGRAVTANTACPPASTSAHFGTDGHAPDTVVTSSRPQRQLSWQREGEGRAGRLGTAEEDAVTVLLRENRQLH